MIGTNCYRKGYDIFIKLAKKHKEYMFCWVGCDIKNDIEYHNNIIKIKSNNNPYKYLKQFDYFLCTSREDIFGLVIIESLYLNIPTIIIENTIGLEKDFVRMGAHLIRGLYNLESISNFITNLSHLKNKKISK
jgi:hypothetical protein